MPHFPAYYHERHSEQVERLRSEIINEMQKISRSIDKTNNRISEVSIEMRHMRSQIDALVVHLLLPDLPIQKINEAIREVTQYHDILEKRQSSFNNARQTLTVDIERFIASLMKLMPTSQQNTDGLIKIDVPLQRYEEHSADEMIEEQ